MPEESKLRLEMGLAVALFSALTVIGATIGGLVVDDFARARASLGWPSVAAVVLSDAADRPGLRYVYSYEGRSYESRRTSFFTGRFSARRIAAAAPGDIVAASINPADPRMATLTPGGSVPAFAAFVAGAGVLVFVGLGGLIRTIAEAARLERQAGEVACQET